MALKWWESKNRKEKNYFVFGIIATVIMVAVVVVISVLGSIGFADSFFNKCLNVGGGFPKTLLDTLMKLVGTAYYFCLLISIGIVARFILSILFFNSNNKVQTIVRLIKSLIKYAMALGFLFVTLSLWGVDARAIIASAGILALIVGLGAQSMIADIIAGINIVFEGEYRVGDIVLIDGFRGTVEEIGLTMTRVVDPSENVKILNNSKVASVINLSNKPSIVFSDIGIEYDADLRFIEKVIEDHAEEMKNNIPGCLDAPKCVGVASFGDSAVVIRIVTHSTEANRFAVERGLNRELFLLFQDNNINIPFPQVTLSYRDKQNN